MRSPIIIINKVNIYIIVGRSTIDDHDKHQLLTLLTVQTHQCSLQQQLLLLVLCTGIILFV